MSEWVRMSERKPAVSRSYLVCTDRGKVCTAHFWPQSGRWNGRLHGHVTHWMPLPEAPEEYRNTER